jgi:EmrB/QacA subfamily drug resistance transporter
MTARTDLLLLANALMGQFLSGFAMRIFVVSLPTIAESLDADIVAISWALIAYQVAGISLSVVFGRLGDLHGRYTIYGLGFALMALSSLLCGIAPNVLLLVLFRLVQGIGAAMIASAARVLALEAMPEGSEGRANGFMTVAFHVGVLLGPPLGGLLIDLLSWRWIFFLLVPLGVTGVVLTVLRGRERREVAPQRAPAIDYVGAALLVVLTVVLTLLLDRRSAELAGVGHRGLMLVLLAVVLAGFVARERRVANPVVNLALFKIRMFTFSVLSLVILATSTSVLNLLVPFYIQDVLHLPPTAMGLIFLAAPVFTIVLAPVAGQLTDRIGPRLPASIGLVMTMGAFVVGFVLRVDSHWILPTALMAFFGLGSGLFNTPNQTAIIGSVPREYRGFATGMVQTVFGIGSLLGIALAGVLLTVLFRYHSGVPDASPTPSDPRAFVAAMNGTYLVCLALMLIALAASLMRGRTRVEAPPSV